MQNKLLWYDMYVSVHFICAEGGFRSSKVLISFSHKNLANKTMFFLLDFRYVKKVQYLFL